MKEQAQWSEEWGAKSRKYGVWKMGHRRYAISDIRHMTYDRV